MDSVEESRIFFKEVFYRNSSFLHSERRAPLGKRDQGGFRLTLRMGFARDALPACFPHSGRQASVLLRSLLTPYNPLETTRAVALDPGLSPALQIIPVSIVGCFAACSETTFFAGILGCRPNLPEGFHPSDSLLRFALMKAFTLKVSLQSFGLGLKAMELASLGRKCNRHHAGFKMESVSRHTGM